jgi:hypothetical protein
LPAFPVKRWPGAKLTLRNGARIMAGGRLSDRLVTMRTRGAH